VDRFVVGTGRCGSTLLSRMLAEHPAVCSVFEFFTGLDWAERFAPGKVPGPALAALLARPQPVIDAVLRRGYPVEEVAYPFGRGRYRPGDPMPWLLVSMLPRLSDDPDALFEALMAFAAGLPAQAMPAHYRAVFAWLAAHSGRTAWIERSGSSIDYLEALGAAFPDARFVHLHRDGREAALSMREHHAYRLPIALMYDAPLDSGERLSELPPIDLATTPSAGDPVSRILASRPPVALFGRYWSDQLLRGFRALRGIDAGRYLEVRFEDLLVRPRPVLAEIAAFFALDGAGGDWLERAAGLVGPGPAPRFDALSGAEQAALSEACRPGMMLLGRA
jgi:hypothetical protein